MKPYNGNWRCSSKNVTINNNIRSINYITGDPILTVTSPGITLSGTGINGPSSMSGGTPINYINQNKN